MTSLNRRTLLVSLAPLAALALPLAARAGYNIWTNEYTVGRAELQAQIEKRFPADLRVAQLIEVQLSLPRLGLNESANRASVTTDVVVNSPFANRPLNAVLTISSGLKFDPQALAVRLNDPSAEQIDVQGLSRRDAQQLQAIGSVVAREVLKDYPLHTFKPDELRRFGRTFTPGAITVTAEGIKVQLD
ncbi:MAG: putative transrane protein [Rhizobacter sp.]|jgi:hypothetical protein|nr:putative transrane protein [Rhizobacter sp.]